MSAQRDVLIIGGGVIGLSTAYYLAKDGVRLAVVERGECGREASWAGAGIIPPANFERATNPFNKLLGLSSSLYPALSAELRERTGIDNEYRVCGGIELRSAITEAMVATWRAEGIRFELVPGRDLPRIDPALSPKLEAGYWQPDMAQVRNPRHVRALVAACQSLGVELIANMPVAGFRPERDRIIAVQTETGELTADRFLVATGAWSAQLLEWLAVRVPVFPVRGQIVLFNPGQVVLKRIVLRGADYLVPRADGRILAGSTEENVGFVKETTAEAIDRLIAFARELVPQLRQVPRETAWAGLRPGVPHDELPYLGRVPGTSNLFLAAGHFRSGLMLSPATGRVMSEVLTGRAPSVPLEPFAVAR